MKKALNILIKIGVTIFILYAAYGYLTSSAKHKRTITKIEQLANEAIITVNDNQKYLLDFNATPYNRNNFLLLYEGKDVWIIKERDNKNRMTPVKEKSMPLITKEKYSQLVSAGFTDSDIEYSYVIPDPFSNPNKEKPTYGGRIAYGAPSLLIRKISH